MPSDGRVEFVKVIKLLSEAGVDFVIIGGLAIEIQGGSYLTVDSDFAIVRKRENARAIASAIAPYHPLPVEWPEGLPFVWDEQTIMNSSVLTLDSDLGRIDFLAEPAGAPPYAELKAGASVFDLDGFSVFVASIDDLIAMKLASGRPKDIAHIAELETLKRLNEE